MIGAVREWRCPVARCPARGSSGCVILVPQCPAGKAHGRERRCPLVDAQWSTDPHELSTILTAAHRLSNSVEAFKLSVIHQADACDIAKTLDATSTANWVAGALRIDPRRAHQLVNLAKQVDRNLPATRSAFAAGDISLDHVQVVAHTVSRLPKQAPLADVDKTLAEQATTFPPTSLCELGNHVLDVVDPDLADQILEAKLAKEEREALDKRELTITPTESGLVWVRAKVDPLTAERIRLILEPLSLPRKSADGPDYRHTAQRMGDAFCEFVETALTYNTTTHGGNRTQLVVVLKPGTDIGTSLHTGQELSSKLVRQLSCDCDVSYALPQHDRPGHVHLTDPDRLFTGKLRRLLELRDGGCAFPGCDRPPGWCHAHHVVAWSKGGQTVLDNGILLCGHHHRVVHQGNWQIRMTRDGLPEFVPPPWIDGQQTPIRNTIHHL